MKRVCLGYPGYRCPRLIERGSRCEECQRATYQKRNRMRPKWERTFYTSAAWRNLADAVVASATECAECHTPPAFTGLTAGHIVPIRKDPSRALDPSNVAASCRSCQERAKAEPDPAKWPAWARTPRIPQW